MINWYESKFIAINYKISNIVRLILIIDSAWLELKEVISSYLTTLLIIKEVWLPFAYPHNIHNNIKERGMFKWVFSLLIKIHDQWNILCSWTVISYHEKFYWFVQCDYFGPIYALIEVSIKHKVLIWKFKINNIPINY